MSEVSEMKFVGDLTLESTYLQIGEVVQQMQTEIKQKEAILKSQKEDLRIIQEVLLPEKMNNEGVSTVNVTGVGRFTCTNQERVSVKGGCQPDLRAWLTENGYGALITETINSSTLKAFVKERLQEGDEVPVDFLNMHSFERVTLTKK